MINIKRIAEHITLGILDTEGFALAEGLADKRQTEQNGTKLLLKNLYDDSPPELCYTPENKPYFRNSPDHLSISHSHGKLAVLINRKESCGVDIELIRDKVVNIRHKFLSEEELEFSGEDVNLLTTLWAAKEAIYKAYGLKQIDFIAHMKIEKTVKSETDFLGYLHKDNVQKKYLLRKDNLENYALVYTLNEVR